MSLISILVERLENQAPFLLGWFSQIRPDNGNDPVAQRRKKLTRVLNKNNYLKYFQIGLLLLLQPFLWMFRHKLLVYNLTTLSLAIFLFVKAETTRSQDNKDNLYTRCGKIIDMKQTDSKGGSVYNHIWVLYSDNKKIEEHDNVADQTYYTYKKGDNICFDFVKEDATNTSLHYFIASIVFVVMWVVGAAVFMVSLETTI